MGVAYFYRRRTFRGLLCWLSGRSWSGRWRRGERLSRCPVVSPSIIRSNYFHSYEVLFQLSILEFEYLIPLKTTSGRRQYDVSYVSGIHGCIASCKRITESRPSTRCLHFTAGCCAASCTTGWMNYANEPSQAALERSSQDAYADYKPTKL